MPSVTRYAGAVKENPGAWDTPEQALGAHDNYCTTKLPSFAATGEWIVRFTTVPFNLPSNAIIDNVYHGFHAIVFDPYNCASLTCLLRKFTNGTIARGVVSAESASLYGCDNCISVESDDDQPDMQFTVAELNDTTKFDVTFSLVKTFALPYGYAYVDWCWVRVVYHVPALAPYMSGDGLGWFIKAGLTGFRPTRTNNTHTYTP